MRSPGSSSLAAANAAPTLPSAAPSHVVVVVLDRAASTKRAAAGGESYLDALIASGAAFDRSVGAGHVPQADLLALFSGSTHRLSSDACQSPFDGPNLAQQLIDAGKSFSGFSAGLESAAYRGCATARGYRRSLAPWANYRALPPELNQPLAAFTLAAPDFAALPTVSFVVPGAGDHAPRRALVDPFVRWAQQHDGLLIVTGEDGAPTAFVGPMIKPGRYAEHVDPYRLLRTIEDLYGLPPIGMAVARAPISDVWN